MPKLFINLSILVFVFSIFSFQNIFAQLSENTCTQTYATYNKAVVSADDLKIKDYPVCVNDSDTGQTITVTSSRGALNRTSLSSGVATQVYYSDSFLLSDIGRSTTVNFTANDGFISSSIATLTVNFTVALIATTEILGAMQKERDALVNDLQRARRNKIAAAKLAEAGRESMTNTTLRERFGIDAKNSATASRLIKEALAAGVIRLQDLAAPPKTRRYLPHWA